MLGRKPSKRPRLSETQDRGGGRHDRQAVLRNIRFVVFSEYEIGGVHPSPYPFDDASVIEAASALVSRDGSSSPKAKGKGRALPDAVLPVGSATTPEAQSPKELPQSSTTVSGVDSASTSYANGKASPDKRDKQPVSKVTTERLFVCRGCLKYMLYESAFTQHEKVCRYKHPPGRKVYQKGATIIWEVDGSSDKLYCQNLCLFAKLFIEHKYVFYDVDGFMFYVLTQGVPSFDYVIGYFSKEKVSYDNYNLACIVTLPMYQKCGWGTLLIEFSYELSRRTAETPGTPERPLSESGRRTYVSYWTSLLVRYFRAAFEVEGEPPPVEMLEQHQQATGSSKKSTKGWEGETSTKVNGSRSGPSRSKRIAAINEPRKERASNGCFEWPTTVEEIADAVHLMPEDVITALLDSGMAQCRLQAREHTVNLGREDLVVTPELVEEATQRIHYKPRVLDPAFVLL